MNLCEFLALIKLKLILFYSSFYSVGDLYTDLFF